MSHSLFKNRILLTLLVGITLFCSACFFEDEPDTPDAVFGAGEWSPTVPFPYNAQAYVGFGIESTGKGYVGMFGASIYDASAGSQKLKYIDSNEFYEYDPAQNLWKRLSDIPDPYRAYVVSFAVGDRGYVLLGQTSDLSIYEYDPSVNKWTKKENKFPGRDRYWASSFVIGNKAYVGGGTTGDELKDFWEYDPAKDSWRSIAPLPAAPRRTATGFSSNGKGYLVGGFSDIAQSTFDDVWEYDPSMNKWTQKAPLPSPQSTAVGFSIGEKGFVALGQKQDFRIASRELLEYDSKEDKWIKRESIPGSLRFSATGFSVGGKGYVGLGREDYEGYRINGVYVPERALNDFYAYTPYRARR